MSAWRIEEIPAFCITLERRPDRWKRFQDQYGVSYLPKLRRFLAVDGKTIDVIHDPRIAIPTKRNILIKERRSHEEIDSVGAVGCALSHIAIWQWMRDNNAPIVLVFEDDAVVPPDFVSRANSVIEKSAILQKPGKSWDLWLIGANWQANSSSRLEKSSFLEKPSVWFLSHCYVITLPYAAKLLEDALPITTHIDFWMSNYAIIHKSRQVATPLLKLTQYERAKTDIQTNGANVSVVDVPTNFTDSHVLVTKGDWALARTAEALCLVLLGVLAYKFTIKTL